MDSTSLIAHRGPVVRHGAPLVALLLVAGCYQSNPGPLDDAGRWLPALLCDRWERCTESSPWGAEGCEAWMRLNLENLTSPRYEEAITRGTARPSADARALCEAYAASDCGWVAQAAHEDPLGGLAGLGALSGSTSCPHLIEGLVPVGAECAMDEECAGDALCDFVSCDDGCRGVCRAAGPEGAPCHFLLISLAFDECQPGLECASDGTEGRCRRMPVVGEACADGFSPTCARGGRCVDGTCVAVDSGEPTSGERCGTDTPPCAGALVCDEVCVVAPGEGGACLGAGLCGDGLMCDDTVCRREPSEGEPCGPGGVLSGPYCPGILRCSAGICVAGRANGEACTDSRECLSWGCENGACVAPPYRTPG